MNNDKQAKWTHHDVKRGDAEAMKWLRQDTERGNSEAMYRLGMCYLKGHGHGIRRDRNEAIRWFRHAAKRGHAEAQYQLGDCYLRARGVDRNNAEAVKWFSKAVERGNKDAAPKLFTLLRKIEEEATDRNAAQERWMEEIKKYRKAAEEGNAEAQYQLGLLYSGKFNLSYKVFRGYFLYVFRRYEYRSVSHYSHGCRNYRKAAKWFLQAAEQGHTEAQSKVAECCFDGNGVPKNPEEAIKWLYKANRILKYAELAKRLKALAEREPSQDDSSVVLPIGSCERIYDPASPIQTAFELRGRYASALNHVQRYGIDAMLICDTEGFSLEINYPDRLELVRAKLESIFELELMERFLSGATRYKIYKGRGETYPLRDKIARLAELFGVTDEYRSSR